MAFSLKTWVNRISEYPNRRKLTHEDGSTELVTVARAEGQISAEGNAFSAEEMNDLENRIKGGFDEVNQSLTQLSSVSYVNSSKVVGEAITISYPVGFNFSNCYISRCDVLIDGSYQDHYNNNEIIQNIMNPNNVVLILRDESGAGKQIRVIFEKF